jgi:hypothetical protein
MIPQVLIDLIDEYVAEFDQLESLPEIKAIKRLAIKSNDFIIRLATQILGIPVAVIMEIIHREEFSETYLVHILVNTALLADFNTCLMLAMNENYATSSLFWLFIVREPNLYFGPYAKIFEQSLLYKLVNFVTSG